MLCKPHVNLQEILHLTQVVILVSFLLKFSAGLLHVMLPIRNTAKSQAKNVYSHSFMIDLSYRKLGIYDLRSKDSLNIM